MSNKWTYNLWIDDKKLMIIKHSGFLKKTKGGNYILELFWLMCLYILIRMQF